jgi:hypothetical protein
MAANIFGKRFTSRERPAWWDVGKENVHHADMTAVAALQLIGEYNVETVPLAVNPSASSSLAGQDIPIGHRAIVRHPTADDPEARVFGVVGPDYRLITPQDVAVIWDEHVAQPIQTMGALRHGSVLFVTTNLPAIDVKGDPVTCYLGLFSPMDGSRAASVEVFPVRVECENTLKMAQAMATEVYRIVHDDTAKERLGFWLTDVYEQAVQRVEVISEAFDILAGRSVTKREVVQVLETTYPLPTLPRQDAPADVMELRMERWEKARDRVFRWRDGASGLFAGGSATMTAKATKGTAWGLYNAVAETEDWRRTNASVDSVTENLLIGYRAEVKRRAFEGVMELVG